MKCKVLFDIFIIEDNINSGLKKNWGKCDDGENFDISVSLFTCISFCSRSKFMSNFK